MRITICNFGNFYNINKKAPAGNPAGALFKKNNFYYGRGESGTSGTLLFGLGESGTKGTLLFGLGESGTNGTLDAYEIAISAAIMSKRVTMMERILFNMVFSPMIF